MCGASAFYTLNLLLSGNFLGASKMSTYIWEQPQLLNGQPFLFIGIESSGLDLVIYDWKGPKAIDLPHFPLPSSLF